MNAGGAGDAIPFLEDEKKQTTEGSNVDNVVPGQSQPLDAENSKLYALTPAT